VTRFILIRHGTTDSVGRTLSGRNPGVHLTSTGRDEVRALAPRLAALAPAALYTSPLERTRETAALLAERTGLEPRACEQLNEVDFGEWTGRGFDELAGVDGFRRFNAFRSGNRPEGGESALEVQMRMVGLFERLRAAHADGVIALVSHADVIKAALLYWLGLPLDAVQRIEVAPASLSIVDIWELGARVTCMNDRAGAHPA
jgi:probable phosphoglycerate mutase